MKPGQPRGEKLFRGPSPGAAKITSILIKACKPNFNSNQNTHNKPKNVFMQDTESTHIRYLDMTKIWGGPIQLFIFRGLATEEYTHQGENITIKCLQQNNNQAK